MGVGKVEDFPTSCFWPQFYAEVVFLAWGPVSHPLIPYQRPWPAWSLEGLREQPNALAPSELLKEEPRRSTSQQPSSEAPLPDPGHL